MYNFENRRNSLYSRPTTFNVYNQRSISESNSLNCEVNTIEPRKSSISELLSALNSTEFSQKKDNIYFNQIDAPNKERKSSLSENYFPSINESYFPNQANNSPYNPNQPMDINFKLNNNLNLTPKTNYNFGCNAYNNPIPKIYNNFDQGMNNNNNNSPPFINNIPPPFINNSSSSFINNSSPQFINNSTPLFPKNFVPPFISKPSYEKPPFSYAQLISQAILSAADYLIPLSGIYAFISNNYPYYQNNAKGWQNSIRHNLSLNKYFIRISRYSMDPGKGSLWTIEKDYLQKVYMDAYMPKQTRLKPKKMIDSASDKTPPNSIYSASNELSQEISNDIIPREGFNNLKDHGLDRRNSNSSFTIEHILSRNSINSSEKQTFFARTLSISEYNQPHDSNLNIATSSYNNIADSVLRKTSSISFSEMQRKT